MPLLLHLQLSVGTSQWDLERLSGMELSSEVSSASSDCFRVAPKDYLPSAMATTLGALLHNISQKRGSATINPCR